MANKTLVIAVDNSKVSPAANQREVPTQRFECSALLNEHCTLNDLRLLVCDTNHVGHGLQECLKALDFALENFPTGRTSLVMDLTC